MGQHKTHRPDDVRRSLEQHFTLDQCFANETEFKGADILRTIRSFDPCMPCTTHVYAGQQTIVREVNTCACILEDEGEPVPADAD